MSRSLPSVPQTTCSLCACLAALRGSVGKFARNDAHSARNSDNGLAASRGVVNASASSDPAWAQSVCDKKAQRGAALCANRAAVRSERMRGPIRLTLLA